MNNHMIITVAMSTGLRMHMGIRMGMSNGIDVWGWVWICVRVDGPGGETCHLISLLAKAEFIHCRYTVIFLTHLLSLIEIATRIRHFFSRPKIPPVPVRARLTSSTCSTLLLFTIVATNLHQLDCSSSLP